MHCIMFFTGLLTIYLLNTSFCQITTCERELHPEQNSKFESMQKNGIIFILSWILNRFFCIKLIK